VNLQLGMMTTIYVVLFIAVFPALWLLAAYLDRVLPSDVNRHARKSRERREDEAQRGAMEPDEPTDKATSLKQGRT
jgi:hypothetical protein